MSAQKDAMLAAYKQFHKELSEALYDEDPGGMGSSVGAPMDEYDGEAAKLAASLRDSSQLSDVATHLRQSFGCAPTALVQRVSKALTMFNLKCETARRTIPPTY
jgi:hypothetical protein